MLEKSETLKKSGRVIWVYRGLPINSWPDKMEQARKNLFKIVGFAFNTDDGEFDTINACYPLDDPIEHVDTEVRKLIDQGGIPEAILVTSLDGGSNAINVGLKSKWRRDTKKELVLDAYRKIASEYEIPFHHIPLEKLWENT